MPVLDPKLASNPTIQYSGPVQPNYNFWDKPYENRGSGDTTLSRLTGNYYDRSFIPEISQINQRYYNQGTLNAHASNLLKLGIGVGTGVLAAGAAVTALTPMGMIYGALANKSIPQVMDDNPLMMLYNGIKTMADESLPVYVREDFDKMGVLNQLGSGRIGEFITRNNDSIEFIIESFATSGAMAALKLGPRAALALSKIRPMYKVLSSLEGPNLAKLANTIDWLSTSAVLSSTEAFQEASESYQNNVAKLTAARRAGENNFTDDQITSAAQKAADNVFYQNAATLMITNGAFMKLVNPLFKPASALTREGEYALRFAEGNFQLPKYASKGASAFEKFMYDKGSGWGMTTKALLENAVSEGLEESLQYSIQQSNKVDDAVHSDTSFIGSTLRYLKSLPDVIDMTDPERRDATLLGSLMGMGHVAVATPFGLGPRGEAKTYREERDAHLQALQGTYTDFIKSTIYARHPDKDGTLRKEAHDDGTIEYFYKLGDSESKINQQDFEMLAQKNGVSPMEGGSFKVKGEFKMDDKGNLIQDPVKIAQYMNDAFVHSEYDDLIETEQLRTNPDQLKLNLFREQKLAALAKTAFDAGAADILIDRLEQIQNSSDNELKTTGLDPETTRAEMPRMIKHVEELEKLYNTHVNTAIIASNSKDDNNLNRERQNYLYSLGSRMLSLDNMHRSITDELNGKKDALAMQFPDDAEAVTNAANRIADKYYNEDKIEELFDQRNALAAQVIEADFRGELEKKKQIEEGLATVDTEIEKRLKQQSEFDIRDQKELKQYAQDSKVEEIAQLSNKARHVADAREELGRTFDKILAKNGFQAYKEIRTKTKQDPRTIYDSGIKNFQVHPHLTNEMYQFYEDRMVPKLHLEDKATNAAHEFFSELVDRFVDWFDTNWSNLDGKSKVEVATSLRQLVSDILDRKPRLYEESADKLVRKLDETVKEVNDLQAPYLQYLSTLKGSHDPQEHMDELDAFNPEKADQIYPLYKNWKLAQDIKAAMEPLYSNSNFIAQSLWNLINSPQALQSETALRVEAMDRLTNPASRIVDVSGYDGEKIDPEYTDYVSPVFELVRLKTLRDNILPHKGPEFKEMKTKINDLIKQLEEIAKLVEENLRNRDLKNHKENLVYSGSYLISVGINNDGTVNEDNEVAQALISISSAETLNAIAKAAVDNPDIAIKALETIAKQDPALMKRVLLLRIGEIGTGLAQMFNSAFKEDFLSIDEISAMLTSPVRMFKHILSKMANSDIIKKGFSNDDVKAFLEDFDIVRLMETRQRTMSDGSTPNALFYDRAGSLIDNEAFDNLLGAYLNLIAYNSMLIHSESGTSNADALNNLMQYAMEEKDGTKKPTPSIAQERVIVQLANWLSSTPTTSTEINKNVAALKAPPGAGKSLVVTPLALRLAGLSSDNVMSAASTAPAAENLARAVGNTESNTMETMAKLLEDGNIPADVSVILVDEVGPAQYELIDRLSRALARFNRNNTARIPIKMVYIYDPNQVTAGYKDIPDIEAMGYSVPYSYKALMPDDQRKMRLGEYELGSELVFTHNIYDLTPLSATYRSDVGPVQDLFNAFRTTDKVKSLNAASSIDPKFSTKDIQGTFVELDPSNLLNILRSSVVTNADRTRAVIVGSDQKKRIYEDELRTAGIPAGTVQVLTVGDAQGLTFDEVYVDVSRSDNPTNYDRLFESDKAYNKYVYTAVSRAAHFAYLSGFQSTNSVDPSIADKAAVSAANKKSDYDKYVEAKKSDIELLKSLTQDVSVSNQAPEAVPTQETEEPVAVEEGESTHDITDAEVDAYYDKAVDEAAAEAEQKRQPLLPKLDEALISSENGMEDDIHDDESYQMEEALPVEDPEFDHFQLFHPDNYAFSDVGSSPGLQVGDKLVVVKDNYNANPFETKERIAILREEGDGRFRKVAVLSDTEKQSFSDRFGFNLDKLQALPFHPVDGGQYFVSYEGKLGKSQAYSMYVGPGTQPLTYRYSYGEPTVQLSSPKDSLNLFNRWATGLFGPKAHEVILNYKDIQENPEKYMTMKTFGSPSSITRFFEGRRQPRILPKQHVPYLIIQGLQVKGYKDEMAPQYIRLTSNVLNEGTALINAVNYAGNTVTLTMRTLTQFGALVKEFENELEASKALGQYATVRMGVPATDTSGTILKDKNNNPFFVFHALIKALSDQYQQKGKSPIKVLGHSKAGQDIKGLSEDIKRMFPDIDPAVIPQKLLLLAARIDSMQHFGDQYMIEKNKVPRGTARNFNGHAQLVMNKLATSNFMITLPGNEKTGATSMILRDYETTRLASGDSVDNVVGKRLLGPVTAVRHNFAYNPLIRETILRKLEKVAKTLEAAGKTDSVKYKLVTDILAKRNSFDLQNVRLTSDQLIQLTSAKDKQGNYKPVSEGFGLRAPITYTQQGEDGNLIHNKNVGSNFVSVSPTVITVSKVKYEAQPVEEVEKPKPELIKFIQLNGGTKSVEELVSAIQDQYSEQEINAFMKSMKMPSLTRAVQEYLVGAKDPRALRQLGLTLSRTVKNIAAMVGSYDNNAEMLDALYRDDNYWKEDSKTKYGPRDTVRMALAISLYPEIPSSDKLTRLVGLFKQNRWYRVEEFQETAELDQAGFTAKVDNLMKSAFKVAKQHGVDKKVPLPKYKSKEGAIDLELVVEYIAEHVGSAVREALRKNPEALSMEDTAWAQRLATLVHNRDNNGVLEYLKNHPEQTKQAGISLESRDADIVADAYEYVLDNNILPVRDMLKSSEMDDIGEFLSDEEARELYEQLLPASSVPFLSKIFGRRSGESFRILTMNQMQHGLGKNNWGLFKDGIVHIARHASGKVGSKVVKHEVLHKIIWQYLYPHERQMLWELGREKFGNLSDEALEERIVEEFTDNFTKPTGIWEAVKQIYYKIMKFLGFTYVNMTSLDTFFSTVENGYYSGAERQPAMGIERNLKINKDWAVQDRKLLDEGHGALESYLLFEDLLFKVFDFVYHQPRQGEDGRLVSFEEAIEESFFTLQAIYDNPGDYLDEQDPTYYTKVKEAIYPILNPKGRARAEVIDEYFPQNREAERLALAINDLQERYESLLEAKEELDSSENSQELESIEASLKDVEEELGIKSELYEAELRDPHTKLTGRVKQRLGSIEYLEKLTKKRAEFAKTFNALLVNGTQLDHTSTESFITALTTSLEKAYSVRGGASIQRSPGAALAKHIRDTAVNISRLERDTPTSIVFRKDTSSLLEHIIIAPGGKSARNVTRSQVIPNSGYRIVERMEGESLHDFANRILDTSPQFSYDDVRNAYYLYEEQAFVSSLVSAVTSLRNNKPNIGMTYFRYGVRAEYYFPTKVSGPAYVLDSDLTAAISQYIDRQRAHYMVNPEHSEVFTPDYIQSLPLPESTEDKATQLLKRDAMNQFLDIIGINKGKRIVEFGNTQELNDTYFRFYHFIQNLREGFLAPATEEDIATYGDSQYRPSLALIDNEHSIKEAFVQKMFDAFSAGANSVSYRRADGKTAYRFVDASFQSSVLNFIDRGIKAKLQDQAPQGVNAPLHLQFKRTSGGITLTSDAPLLAKNIFLNNNSTSYIREFVDHDGMKMAGIEGWAKYLKAETSTDYHRRNFAFGFLSRLYKSKGASYIQFLPNPPQNRSSIQGAEVTHQSNEGVKSLAKKIILAQMERPTPQEAGLEANAAYVKNYRKIIFPGMVDETGADLTVDKLMEMAAKQVKGKDQKAIKAKAVDLAVDMFLEHTKKQTDAAVEEFLSDFQGKEIEVSEAALMHAAKRLKISTEKVITKKEQAKRRKEIDNNEKLNDDQKTEAKEALKNEAKAPYTEVLRQVMYNFYGNFAVNQYSLAQLVYSDQALYSNKENLSKRIQVATATGDIGLIDASRGAMAPTSRVGVMQDVSMGIEMELEQVRDDSFGEEYDSTDGQGFVLPEFYERMTASYSIESQLDVTLKPVYYAIHENGEVVAIKYSLVVLTDELTNKYPHLAKLREDMRNHVDENGQAAPLDQAVFDSAIKVGNPKVKSEVAQTYNAKTPGGAVQHMRDGKVIKGFDPKSVVTIHNKFLRLQLNPAKQVDGSTRNPSQITAFINSNGKNQIESSKLYGYNSLIIEAGLRKVMKDLKVNSKGGLTKAAQLAIRERLIKLTDDLPGAEDVNAMLAHKTNGRYGISMNIPLLARRVVSALASNVTRESVGFRFPGSKLVLQAQVGISENLKWKDENGYTEVVLPESYRQYVEEGDVLTDGLVGFRIPSTNYHSALALKVKGFYPTPAGSKGNIIIAPSMIVYYHGSDYDIDTLFLMRKESHAGDTLNLNEILGRYGIEANPMLEYNDGDVYGFTSGSEDKINGVDVSHYLFGALSSIESAMDAKRSEISKAHKDNKSALISEIQQMEEDYYSVIDAIQKTAKNAIVHTFSNNLRDIKNRKDVLTPISFSRAAKVKSVAVKEVREQIEAIKLQFKDGGFDIAGVDNTSLENALISGDMDKLEEVLPGSAESDLARRMLVRYGVDKAEDSVMEMQAKRNMLRAINKGQTKMEIPKYPSKAMVDNWIYPIGQLNDYMTQRAIHYNTYSGARLTGISANTGKMLGYLFESTPVTAVIDTVSKKVYKGADIKRLTKLYRMDTLAALMEKHPRFQVMEREDIIIKQGPSEGSTKGYRISVDGTRLDRFSRYERDLKTGEDIILPVSGDKISIFETIDTIINLAIDNVKEQKLFTYGITSANANAFFTMLAMGVPLNTTVKFFSSPIITSMSQNRRVTDSVLNEHWNQNFEKVSDLFEQDNEVIVDALKPFLTEKQIANVLEKKARSKSISLADNLLDYIADNGSINSDVLDAIYTNEALAKYVEPISNLISVRSMEKMTRIGEELFSAAQLFSLLRGMPSDMGKMLYLANRPLDYSKFDYTATEADLNQDEYIERSLEYIKEHDPNYKSARDQKAYLEDIRKAMTTGENPGLINSDLMQMFQRKFTNAMIHSSLRNSISPSGNSVFENVSPLSIPHVYSSWKTLNFLKGLVERTFAVHNPLLKIFADNLVEKADLFTTYNRYEMVEKVATQFFSFITSNLDMTVGGMRLNLDESDNHLSTPQGELYGTEAWATQFIDRIFEAKSVDTTDNRFLSNLEIVISPTGAKSLRMFADKIRDPKIKEGIRADYLALYKDKNTRALALDVFKYAILAEGLLYSRSSLALVFPASFIANYSSRFESRLNTFLSNHGAKTLANLDQVLDLFTFQFMRNNADVARFISGYKPVVTGTKAVGEFSKQLFSGIERDENGNAFYYDLKFRGLNPSSARRFIKRFGTEIYAKIETADPYNTYYRQLTTPITSRYYDIDIENDLDSKYSFEPLLENKLIIPAAFVRKGTIVDDNPNNKYKAGDTVYTFERGSVRPKKLTAYVVSAVNKSGAKVERVATQDVPLNNKENNNVFVKYPALQRQNSFTVVNQTTSKVRAIAFASQDENSLAIVNGEVAENNDTTINIPNVMDHKTFEAVLKVLDNLDPAKTYYIQDGLLEGLDTDYQEEFAKALQRSIGYSNEYIDDLLQSEDSVSLYYELKAASKNRPYFRAGELDDVTAAYSPSDLQSINTDGVARLPYKSLSVFDRTKPGDIVYMGMNGSLPQFAYVEGIEKVNENPTHMVISLVPSNVAAKMTKDNYTAEEYENLLNEFEKESKC